MHFDAHHDWTPQERVAVAARHAPYFAPGAGWHYSNTNYIALGLIAEAVGGAPAPALLRARVLEPNGLAQTFFDGAEPLGGSLAPAFDDQGMAIQGNAGLIGAFTDGAMAATLEDATRWMHAYASASATPHFRSGLYDGPAIPSSNLTYGFALFNLPPAATGDVAAHGHGGDIPGFHSWALDFPERSWTITAIVNQDGGDPNAFLLAVIGALQTLESGGVADAAP